MDKNKYLLEALRAHLEKRTVNWEEPLSVAEWTELFELAQAQRVLPMVVEAVHTCPSYKEAAPQLLAYKRRARELVIVQAVKTQRFLTLYSKFLEAGIQPVLAKGLICRQLYPMPDHRMSADEDIFVLKDEWENYFPVLHEFGMISDKKPGTEYIEMAWRQTNGPLYLELHEKLFSEGSEAYGEFNKLFEGAERRLICEKIQGVPVITLSLNDHLLYLILHALQHFMGSGFGIRQVIDILSFGDVYGNEIDWDYVYRQCEKVHAEVFAAALFDIGVKYLGYRPMWWPCPVESESLLLDLMEAGVYGGSSMSRKHSSTITQNAVIATKQGRKKTPHLVRTIFPSRKNMVGGYPYLEKYPFLLPMAWSGRIWGYLKEIHKNKGDNNPQESINIGNNRLNLLKKYGILR